MRGQSNSRARRRAEQVSHGYDSRADLRVLEAEMDRRIAVAIAEILGESDDE